LVDAIGETQYEVDDMSDFCVNNGWNLEFRFVRRTGVPMPPGVGMSAECELSQNKAIDCPNLPG
jgi:hypothetical protein